MKTKYKRTIGIMLALSLLLNTTSLTFAQDTNNSNDIDPKILEIIDKVTSDADAKANLPTGENNTEAPILGFSTSIKERLRKTLDSLDLATDTKRIIKEKIDSGEITAEILEKIRKATTGEISGPETINLSDMTIGLDRGIIMIWQKQQNNNTDDTSSDIVNNITSTETTDTSVTPEEIKTSEKTETATKIIKIFATTEKFPILIIFNPHKGYIDRTKLDELRDLHFNFNILSNNETIPLTDQEFYDIGQGHFVSKSIHKPITTVDNNTIRLIPTSDTDDRYIAYPIIENINSGSYLSKNLNPELNFDEVNIINYYAFNIIVHRFNREIEKTLINHSGELTQLDREKIVSNIKKANPHMPLNTIINIDEDEVAIYMDSRTKPIKLSLDSLIKRVRNVETSTDMTMQDIDDLINKVDELKNTLKEAEVNLTNKTLENESLEENKRSLMTEKERLQALLDEKERELRNNANNIADLRAEVLELETRVTDLTNNINTLNDRNTELIKEKATLEQERDNLRTQLIEKNNEITSLNSQIQEKDRVIAELREQLRQKESDNSASREEIARLKEQIATLTREKEELNRDLSTAREEKADLQTKKTELEAQIVEKDKLIKAKDDRNTELIKEKDDLIKAKENKIKELEKQVASLNGKTCSINDEEKNNLIKIIQKLENEVSNLKDEVRRVNISIPRGNINMSNDINIGQWFPERIVRFPNKRQYVNNEMIDLSGMVICFTKYIKEYGEYKAIHEDVVYDMFRNEIHGWQFNLKTPIALYNKDTNGKMQIKFSFILRNLENSKGVN